MNAQDVILGSRVAHVRELKAELQRVKALYRLTEDHAANTTWANTSKVEVKFGNELSDAKIACNNSKDIAVVPVEFTTTMNVQSAIDAKTGTNAETGARTGYISYNKPLVIKFPKTEYIFTVWAYTTNSTTAASYSPTEKTYTTLDAVVKPITGNNPCLRIGIKRVSGGAISSSDASALFGQIKFYYITDTTLQMSGVPADAKKTGEEIQNVASAESEIRNQVFKYNSVDAFYFGNGGSRSDNGIDYTRNTDGTWTLDGTATDTSASNIINSAATVPDYIIPGKTYTLKFDGTIVPIRFYFYYSDSTRNDHFTVTENDKEITIPNDIIGLIVRFQITSGTSFTDETIGVHLLSELSSGGTNIYNISVSPEITTDNHNWLQATGDTTDMASAIVAMLTETGYCKLSPGVFYVGGSLNVPEGTTIEGCGRDTVIRLLSSVSSGYAVKIKNYATIKDLSISGSTSTLTPSGDIGNRHGILFEAAYGLETGNETSHCMVNNVWIENFNGAGIKCSRTSINYAKGLYAEQIFINRCHTGIYIELLSEFNKFVNCCIARCYNACENNGGNNVFTSCTFHATHIGFLMDDTDGTHGNNGHGTMTACTFCHIGSNEGSAITAKNIKNGFVFSACQVWYNSIDLTDCDGFVFNAFEFGKGIHTNKGATINITGGNTVMFNGCVFMDDTNNPPEITITNNTKVKFNGCYGSTSGNAITTT